MPRADMRRAWKERPISTFFATGCGIGMIPWAPGTWGSAEGLAAAWLIAIQMGDGSAVAAILGLGVLIALAGIFWGGRAEAACGEKDPGPVVIDEVAGQLIASAPVSLAAPGGKWWLWLVSFALFRLFDIWKPGPIRKIQELPGGWGIMLDDVAAGVLAGAITYGVARVL